jgi:ribosome-associated protein
MSKGLVMPNDKLRDVVIEALEDKKGSDIQSLDVLNQTDITDYMVVASGSSNRQVKALATSVIDQTRAIEVKPYGIEGMEQGEWVLIDLVDVVVHLMLPKVREFYDLERLWSLTPNKEKEDVGGNDQ